MALKFCFQHEIHRCSELPEHFEALTSFLTQKFKVELPSDFGLYYTDSDGQHISVSSEEDFQDLKERSTKRLIKVFITKKDGVSRSQSLTSVIDDVSSLNSDYGVIQQESQSSELKEEPQIIKQEDEEKNLDKPLEDAFIQEKIIEDSDLLVEQLSQDLIKNVVMPRLEERKVSDSNQDGVNEVVRESLKDQMPFIVSQIREVLNRERLIMQQEEALKASQVQEVVEVKPADNQGKNDDFFAKIINSIKEFPNKAVESIDNFTQKLEGDPYVYVNEKKFPTSTMVRAEMILQIFPEQDKIEVIEFVSRYHKAIPVDKIAELYMIKKEL